MKLLFQIITIIGYTVIANHLWAQDQPLLDISNHSDCISRMTIETRRTVGPTTAPVDHGSILEFDNNSKDDVHFMETENHSVWYEFSAKTKGQLTVEIEPLDSLNDYDFALYKYTDENFCADVIAKKILPIRTNFSRNKPELSSKTGLQTDASNEFIGSGINPAYSQAVEAKPKEKYVLLVNNVYANGDGHILHFNYAVNLSLKGEVFDVDGETALDASVTLTNTKTGNVVAETTSDSITGAYELVFSLPKSQLNDPLHLEISKDDYFFHDTIITAYKIATDMRHIKLTTKIKKLKKGDRFVVGNILFHGNSPEPLDRSMPTLKALYKTLKRNKKLRISIEGHTNGCGNGQAFSMELSDARAKTVYNFLVDRSIDKQRLSAVGYGCQFMLHDMAGSMAQFNRRVEIEVVDL